jgi:hypothetical protein
MGKLIVTEFMTLDGVAQAPGGPDEDRDGGFTHGGWQAPLVEQKSGGVVFEQARTISQRDRPGSPSSPRIGDACLARFWPAVLVQPASCI